MDLITHLPKTRSGHDAIVVFVDRLSKMVHFQPTTTTATAPDIAKLFFETIFRLHGMPNIIVSDRDPRFTSLFWKALFKCLAWYSVNNVNSFSSRNRWTDRKK